MRKVLKTYTRKPWHWQMDQHITAAPDTWWDFAQRSRITSMREVDFRRIDDVLISAFVER